MAASAGGPHRGRMADIEAIIKDPAKHFRHPADVLRDASLGHADKRRILQSWALDSQLLEVAEEENMGGPDRPGLRDVKLALIELEKEG